MKNRSKEEEEPAEALTASVFMFRVLGFNSNLFNFRPPSPGKLNPNGWARPKLDGINNSGLKCYCACDFFFLFLGKPWIGAFIFIHIFFFHG